MEVVLALLDPLDPPSAVHLAWLGAARAAVEAGGVRVAGGLLVPLRTSRRAPLRTLRDCEALVDGIPWLSVDDRAYRRRVFAKHRDVLREIRRDAALPVLPVLSEEHLSSLSRELSGGGVVVVTGGGRIDLDRFFGARAEAAHLHRLHGLPRLPEPAPPTPRAGPEGWPPLPPIPLGALALGELLGRGSSAEVTAARHPAHGEVVVKRFRPGTASAYREAWTFAHIGAHTADPRASHVIRCLGGAIEGDAAHLVLERGDGTLAGWRHEGDAPFPPPALARQLAAVALGLSLLSELDRVHRDLRPGNILLAGGSAKLMDFGLTGPPDGEAPAGSAPRQAPEVVLDPQNATPASDVFSFGTLLHELCTGRALDDLDALVAGRLPEPEGRWRPEIAALLRECWRYRPEDRPSPGEIAGVLGASPPIS